MNPLIEQHLDAIRALAREYGVTRLELFGSAATGEFDPVRSDVDFIVTYPAGYDYGPWGERLFALQDRLKELLGRDVDLLTTGSLRNPYFIAGVEATRQQLFAA